LRACAGECYTHKWGHRFMQVDRDYSEVQRSFL